MKLIYELEINVEIYEQFKDQVMATWFECDEPLFLGHEQVGPIKFARFITDKQADRKTFERLLRKLPYDSLHYRLVIAR